MEATKEKSIKKAIRRKFEGDVVSVAEDKTIHVLVKVIKRHPKYQKQYTVGKKYHVHDEKNKASLGDQVTFEECRPLSKTKRWRLVKVIKK